MGYLNATEACTMALKICWSHSDSAMSKEPDEPLDRSSATPSGLFNPLLIDAENYTGDPDKMAAIKAENLGLMPNLSMGYDLLPAACPDEPGNLSVRPGPRQ
jgi:hypothetical protein